MIAIWAVEPENAAILSGGSIGTHLQMGIGDGLIPENLNNVAAAIRLAKKLGPGKRVVTILPDTGERYYSTVLFEND